MMHAPRDTGSDTRPMRNGRDATTGIRQTFESRVASNSLRADVHPRGYINFRLECHFRTIQPLKFT